MFNGSGSTIERMRPLFNVLETQFDVVLHDQRGLGRTEIPQGPYSMAAYAADAIALVDHLGWESFNVMGISFGGMVAQEFAVTIPDRIEKLALLCTSPGGLGGSSYPLHELRSMSTSERAALSMTIMDTRFTPEWLATHPTDKMFVDGISGQYSAVTDSEVERGEIEQLNARRTHDVWDRLGVITAPTFIGAGRYDGIAPLLNSEAMAARIPNSELHVYEGGHGFFAQDAAAFPDMFRFFAD
ncbi:MAG: alpha/beta fold hydrolase [Acidimicrobiales bacterium]